MTEYRDAAYDSDSYPVRDDDGTDGGGTIYRAGPPHGGTPYGAQNPAGGPDGRNSPPDPIASIRGRVWRPTRGPRAEESARTDPGYGAPERGWRTSDGGYRSSDGGWRAPYRPYDTGEFRRDARLDTGPASTGEIVRYTPPVTGEPPAHRVGTTEVPRYPQRGGHTGEIVRYRGRAEETPAGATGTPGSPAYYRAGVDASAGRGYSGSTGEIAKYRDPATETPRPPAAGWDTGRASRRPGETGEMPRYPGATNSLSTGEIVRYSGPPSPRNTGEIVRYPGPPNPRNTGEIARYSATPDVRDPEAPRYPVSPGAGRRPSDTDGRGLPPASGRYDTNGRGLPPASGRHGTDGRGMRAAATRYDTDGSGRRAIGGRHDTDGQGRAGGAVAGGPSPAARRPTETGETARIPLAGYQSSGPTRRAPENDRRRDDPPELYSYDPLTLGGGESPAMRYDPATESYQYNPAAGPTARPSGGPPTAAPRPSGFDTHSGELRSREAREYGGRGYAGDDPDAGRYGGPRYRREPEPSPREEMPARRPANRGYDQPPVRRGPTRPQQRFEGTYPPRAVRNPRNIVPPIRRGQEADEDEEDAPGFFHTALVTTAWYTIPLLLYTMYVLTLDGSAEAGDGKSPRESALNGLLGGMPRVGVALLTSLAVALLIRLIGRGWRAATIGFASAVVGGGVATVVFTALTG